jgi:hypothetical protein
VTGERERERERENEGTSLQDRRDTHRYSSLLTCSNFRFNDLFKSFPRVAPKTTELQLLRSACGVDCHLELRVCSGYWITQHDEELDWETREDCLHARDHNITEREKGEERECVCVRERERGV